MKETCPTHKRWQAKCEMCNPPIHLPQLQNMDNPEVDYIIREKLEKLFLVCLENSGVYREYTDEELFQACFIFTEVFMAKMHKEHKNKIGFDELCTLAEEAGKSLHQTVLLFTGVDLKNIKL